MVLFGMAIPLVPWSLAATSDTGAKADSACFVLTGLGGLPEYEENFRSWGTSTEEICREQIAQRVIHLDGSDVRKERILSELDDLRSVPEGGEVWLFLIGHATHDRQGYKFNIKGPDLTDNDLAAAVDGLKGRRVFLVAATSCSGGLQERLSGQDRVVLTATQSARERHAPLFMSFFVEAARSAEADRNKDRRISIQEAFTFSEAAVKEWYESKGRLQTEHPILRDGSEGAGLASIAYLSSPPEQAYRTLEAQELAPQRKRLEREIEDLKLRKADLSVQEYFTELERLLLALAETNERIRQLEGEP